MIRCTACKDPLPSSGVFVVCAGCDGGFHYECSGLSRATWKAKGESKKLEWRCVYCRRASKSRDDPVCPPLTVPSAHPDAAANLLNGDGEAAARPATDCHLCGSHFRTSKGLSGHLSRSHTNTTNTASGETRLPCASEPFHASLAAARRCIRIIPRIPKGARIIVAERLATVVSSAASNNDEASWQRLLRFAFTVLERPRALKRVSLTTQVKKNLAAFDDTTDISGNPPSAEGRSTRRTTTASQRAQAKLNDGDVKGAVRLLCSEDDIAPFSNVTLEKLREKHPPAKQDARFPDPPHRSAARQDAHFETELQQRLRTTAKEIVEAVRSFATGSAGGLDGLRPQHLKDLLSPANGEAANTLAEALARLVDLMLDGCVAEDVCPYLYGATLTALRKKDGGIRPIAVGNTLRRLAAKIGCRRNQAAVGSKLRPHQLGFGTPGGAEAAVHATRRFVEAQGPPRLIVKLDFVNAFNAMHRDHMLQSAADDAPSLYPLAWQCYRYPTILSFGDSTLESAEGCQQGDPIGPLLFCLGLQPLCRELRSPLNVWYLDDGTLGGTLQTILEDIKATQAFSECSGLRLNPSKCEVFLIGHTAEEEAAALCCLEELLPGIRRIQRPELSLLGSPLTEEAIPLALRVKDEDASRMGERLQELSPHNALFLLKNCLAIPKLIYIIRTCPSWLFAEDLLRIDETFRSVLQRICNTAIEGTTWRQASLPVSKGGLGIRRVEELAVPAFLASSYATGPLVTDLLSRVAVDGAAGVDAHGLKNRLLDAEETWVSESERLFGARLPLPPVEQRGVQRCWDEPLTEGRLRNLLDEAKLALDTARAMNADPKSEACQSAAANVARLTAAATKESGQWIQALPSPSLGTFLDPDALRVAVALRLGAPICVDHTCRCGAPTNSLGRHGLSCRVSAGRHPRHHALNDVIRRALGTAGIPSRLEPTGLDHDAGLRADGLTMVPWANGRPLTWDVTCVDTFAASHVASTSQSPGAAADRAEELKRVKYLPLANRYIFAPMGFETMGTFGGSCSSLIREIGGRITSSTGEVRATEFLRQRISVEIQKGNALAIFGTFPPWSSFDEMFLLL